MRRVMRTLRDPESVLTTAGQLVLDQNKSHFDKAKGRSSIGAFFSAEVAWHALTAGYFVSKTRKGFANWMMVRGRGLMQSLTVRGATNNVFRVGKASVDVGTKDKVAGYHDTDWKRAHGKDRRVVFLTEADREGILDVLVEGTRAAWTGDLGRLRAAYARRKQAAG